MTLNVVVGNMVAVDSEASTGPRVSDDWKKSQPFRGKNYHGILIANGNGLTLKKAQRIVRTNEAETIDELLEGLEITLEETRQQQKKEYIQRTRTRIETKYQTVSDEKQREDLITREFATEMDKLEDAISKEKSGAIHVVAYDKKQETIRKFYLNDREGAKVADLEDIPVLPDGSGGDLAGAYLTTNISGIDWETISPEQTFYLTALSCASATANAGVGGFMNIATVSEEGVKYVEREKVNAAVRVCSKQIAGVISKRDAMRYTAQIFNGEANYGTIARRLGIKEKDLILSPTSLQQDVSRFNLEYQREE